MIKIIYLFILAITTISTLRISTKPSAVKYKNNLPLFWKLTKKYYITNRPKRFIFNDYPITVYRDYTGEIIALSDICVHRGASLSQGKLLNNNCLQCPYHGWEYNKGIVDNIPGCPDTKRNFGAPSFLIEEILGIILCLNVFFLDNSSNFSRENSIFCFSFFLSFLFSFSSTTFIFFIVIIKKKKQLYNL